MATIFSLSDILRRFLYKLFLSHLSYNLPLSLNCLKIRLWLNFALWSWSQLWGLTQAILPAGLQSNDSAQLGAGVGFLCPHSSLPSGFPPSRFTLLQCFWLLLSQLISLHICPWAAVAGGCSGLCCCCCSHMSLNYPQRSICVKTVKQSGWAVGRYFAFSSLKQRDRGDNSGCGNTSSHCSNVLQWACPKLLRWNRRNNCTTVNF